MINLKEIKEINQQTYDLKPMVRASKWLLVLFGVMLLVEYGFFYSEAGGDGKLSQKLYLMLLGAIYFTFSAVNCYKYWKNNSKKLSSLLILLTFYAIIAIVISNTAMIVDWMMS